MKIITRQKYINAIVKAFDLVPIVVLMGARQVGKTFIMKSLPTDTYKDSLMLNGQDPNIADCFNNYKYDKPVKIKALRDLSAELNIVAENCYVANINRFALENDVQMMPGFWADRMTK